jgi:hypothetical protein
MDEVAPSVAPSKIPEVKAFLKAAGELAELRALFPIVFAKLDAIAIQYNAALKAAEAVTKERRVSCGPFELYSFSRKFDGDALYEAVGRQKFAAMGGVLEPVELRTVDKERYLALLVQGKIAEDVDAKVLSLTPSFHKPAVLSVPPF